MSPVLRAVATALMLVFAHAVLAQSADATEAESPEQPGFEVAGISASGGEDDPRVLYILPWQAPSLPRHATASLILLGIGSASTSPWRSCSPRWMRAAAPAPGRTEPGSAGTGSTTFNPDAGKPPPVPADPEPAGVAALNRSARPDPTVTQQ